MKKIVLVTLLILSLNAFAESKKVYFKSCKEAKAKGYSNIKKGEEGYRKELDRDGDGIACETK